jgi:hypothetical protein
MSDMQSVDGLRTICRLVQLTQVAGRHDRHAFLVCLFTGEACTIGFSGKELTLNPWTIKFHT